MFLPLNIVLTDLHGSAAQSEVMQTTALTIRWH